MYESRRIPVKQLVNRLGLAAYDVSAPYIEPDVRPARIRLNLKQHAGAPAQPTVAGGDHVTVGDCVADMAGDALGARIHTSITGTVLQVDPEIVIEA